MDQVIKSPVQIFINNKFFIVAEEVEIKRGSELRKTNPNIGLGTVINITKTKKETKSEAHERAVELQEKDYDQWFQRMIKRRNDPEVHTPV
jgi:hypothetical protein